MSGSNQPTIQINHPESTSGLAIAGLIFAIFGWFTCGLLCIPAAFLCILALFQRGPKGTAIAGLIVGFPGTLFFAFFGLTLILGFLGLGAAATSTAGGGVSTTTSDDRNTPAKSHSEENQSTETPGELESEPTKPDNPFDGWKSEPKTQGDVRVSLSVV